MVQPTGASVLLSASVERYFVSLMRDFLNEHYSDSDHILDRYIIVEVIYFIESKH